MKNVIINSEWVPGYGWFGFPKFSVDSEIGVRYVDANSVTAKENRFIYDFPMNHDGIWYPRSGAENTSSFGENTPKQGPYGLYGGVSLVEQSTIAVVQEPHKIYLMAPEYYVESSLTDGEVSKASKYYKHPYFEYLGSNGDMRFEMAMHNFLAEVPNFFLRQGKLTSFVSKKEKRL